ncbi:MAG: hypothetical protein QXH00_07290 [Candidatus Jordarchaeales archaeon]
MRRAVLLLSILIISSLVVFNFSFHNGENMAQSIIASMLCLYTPPQTTSSSGAQTQVILSSLQSPCEVKTKEMLEKEISRGFLRWLAQDEAKSKVFISTIATKVNNETILELFSEFLQENPKYIDVFNEYIEHQSMLNDLMTEQACLTDEEIEEAVKYGTIIADWNGTIEINGTCWPCNYKTYELNKDGKTLKLCKITVYANSEVIDPYISVSAFPLIAPIWPWGWVNFGEDVYLHIRAPHFIEVNGTPFFEATAFVYYINYLLDSYGAVAIAISGILGAALASKAGNLPGAVAGALAGLITAEIIAKLRYEANLALERSIAAYMQGNNYGVKLVLKVHYLYPSNPFFWLSSTISFWFVWPSGEWRNAVPELPINSYSAGLVANTIKSYTWCWGNEVWIFPYYL